MFRLLIVVLASPLILAASIEQKMDIIRNIHIEQFADSNSLAISFTAFQLSFNITLTKVTTNNPPSFIEDDDGLKLDRLDTIDEEEEYVQMYEDEESQSSLMITNESSHPNCSVEGIILGRYQIMPVEDYHILTVIANDLAHDYEVIDDNKVPEKDEEEETETQRRQRRSAVRAVVRPEVLVVVDTALLAQLGGSRQAATRYARNFWAAVNLRYRHLSRPGVELGLAGVIVASSAASTPYLRDSKVSGNTFEAGAALDLMGKHFYSTKTQFPIFDLVVTLTHLDMCSSRGQAGCRKSTAGYAYVGGACVVNKRLQKINSVAIVEDSGGYSGVIVAAHEVAHLLGAVHDGDAAAASVGGPGARSCGWDEGYIMSDLKHAAHPERALQWSSCTAAQLRHFLATPAASCLRNAPHSSSFSLRAGPAPSLDEQCAKRHGTRSCFSDARVCTQLFCVSPRTGRCISYHPAVEGSSCGPHSSCQDGRCVQTAETDKPSPSPVSRVTKISTPSTTSSSPLPNSIPDTCHDRPRISVKGVASCNTLLKTFGHAYCGNTYVKKVCCASHALFCST